MIYVVSGYRRSGTTAMMKALHCGGLPVLCNSKIDDNCKRLPEVDGYKPTPTGLQFEIGQSFYMDPDFMAQYVVKNPGSAVKVFFDGLPNLPAHDYVVVFMHRDPGEIRESLQRAEDYRKAINMRDNRKDRLPFDVYKDYTPEHVDYCYRIARQRRDMKVIDVNFVDLVRKPIEVLSWIRNIIPIDLEKAAEAIDPDWYRCRAKVVA